MNNNILSAHNLSIGYTDKQGLTTTVLRSFSLNIQQNEVVMILGASGTGKSSLLRCLGLLQTPFSGSLKLSKNAKTAFVFSIPCPFAVAFGLSKHCVWFKFQKSAKH